MNKQIFNFPIIAPNELCKKRKKAQLVSRIIALAENTRKIHRRQALKKARDSIKNIESVSDLLYGRLGLGSCKEEMIKFTQRVKNNLET